MMTNQKPNTPKSLELRKTRKIRRRSKKRTRRMEKKIHKRKSKSNRTIIANSIIQLRIVKLIHLHRSNKKTRQWMKM